MHSYVAIMQGLWTGFHHTFGMLYHNACLVFIRLNLPAVHMSGNVSLCLQLLEGTIEKGLAALEDHPLVKYVTPQRSVTRTLKFLNGE